MLTVLSDPLSPERGQLQFAQGLMRTVVYDNLTRRERKARHVAVAAHLQRTFTDDGAEVAEVIADHYRQALEADPDAVDAADLRRDAAGAYRRAGDRAAGLGAADAATNSYRLALDFVDEADRRAELLHKAGVVAGRAARFDEAIPMLEEAIAALDGLGRASDIREAVAALDRVLCDAGHNIEADNRMQAALAALPADATDYGTAVLLVQAASRRIVEGHVDDETAALLDRAIALAEGLGDRRVLALTLNYLGSPTWSAETARPQEFCSRPPWIGPDRSMTSTCSPRRSITTARSWSARMNRPTPFSTTRSPSRRRLGRSATIGIAAYNRIRSLVRSGQWDRAEDVARAAHRDVGESGAAGTAISVGWLAVLAAWRGDHNEARQLRAGTNVAIDDPQDAAIADCYDVILRHASGDHHGLTDRVVELLEHDTAAFGWRFDTPPLLWPIGIDTALATVDHTAAQRLIDMLAAVQSGHRPPSLSAELVRARVRLAIARGDSDIDVETHLGDAIDRFAELGQPVPEAAARLDLHDWLRANGRDDEAEQIAEPAIATAHSLGAAALLTRVDAARAQIG